MSKDTARARALVEELLGKADVIVGGTRPWDIHVHDERFFTRMIRHGQLGIGEAYMDGWWDCDGLDEMSARFIRADLHRESARDPRFVGYFLKQWLKGIGRKGLAFEVGRSHYDLSNALFESFLDPTMSYSCGYWRHASTLEEAQTAKLDLICRKLDLKPGMTVLEIGCGWGGWARHAAQNYGVSVTGVSVSREQIAYAEARTGDLPITYQLADYRDVQGQYDRVVSIAMFEAVGRRYYETFMDVVDRTLKPDGMVLVHTICGNKPVASAEAAWLNEYIFPNGELPSVGDVFQAAQGRLVPEGAHHLDGDYARTLAAWDTRFQQNWHTISDQFDERFYRMWRFYLGISKGIFDSRLGHLWQFVFTKDGIPGLRITETGNEYPSADAR